MKVEYLDIGNQAEGWQFVYPQLLEPCLRSFSQHPLRGPGFIISVREHMPATGVCALAAFQIEGILRTAYFVKHKDTPRYLTKPLGQVSTQCQKAVNELFAVRDAVAHTHLYSTFIIHGTDGLPQSSFSVKRTADMDMKSKDVHRNRTKILGFNVNPVRVDFRDALLAVAVVNLVVKELQKRTADIPMHRPDGDSLYLDKYIEELLKRLDSKRKRAVRYKLKKLELLTSK